MNIVLVHGILGFRNLIEAGPVGLIPYFRDVAAHFESQGHHVLAVELDKTKGVETRGDQLTVQLAAALAPGGQLDPAQKTHIIAHSMGGLDSRYLLSPANPAPNQLPVRSLTTIGTPHFGSPIADAVDNPLTPQPVKDAIAALLDQFEISLEGLRNLKQDFCRTFSAKYLDRKGVDYFCIAGIGRAAPLKTRPEFLVLHGYISLLTQELNDGLVARSSARWGTPVGEWAADHIDEVGYDLSILPPIFHHLPFYDAILARLAALP
jgi:triacylglycerol lipase